MTLCSICILSFLLNLLSLLFLRCMFTAHFSFRSLLLSCTELCFLLLYLYFIFVDFFLLFLNSSVWLRVPVGVYKDEIVVCHSKSLTLLIGLPSIELVSRDENRSISSISVLAKLLEVFHSDFWISIDRTRWSASKWDYAVAVCLWFVIFLVTISSFHLQRYFFSAAI